MGSIWHEHWHRYVLAARLAEGLDVLDAACGEGFGSHHLARFARSVHGVDISAQAIEHARQRYGGQANLSYHEASVTALPLTDASVDLVVSFETIEHLREQDEMLAEFKRVLRPGGLLALSSPNRPIYSDEAGARNEFHLRELDRDELQRLVGNQFESAAWFGQRLLFQSVIWSEAAEDAGGEMLRHEGGENVTVRQAPDPMYFILLCGSPADVARAVARWRSLSCFADPQLSLLREYEWLARYRWDAQQQIGDLNAEVATLRAKGISAAEQPDSAALAQVVTLEQQLSAKSAQLAAALRDRDEMARRWRHRESLAGWLKWPLHIIRHALSAGSPEVPPPYITIPVYNGGDAARRCIESVLSSDLPKLVRVLVVDDASTDEALRSHLDQLAAGGRISLLRHGSNLGFVHAANRGLCHWPDRDVVLLNSDTEVANDWIARLMRCARQADDIGTVTPFSNNATICSFPRFCERNPLPKGFDVGTLDRRFREVNQGRFHEIPTAVGFCMYIKRACLDRVGLFDAKRFGRGYGEENDFCMRASTAGWRHMLCADVFVYHEGGVSFGLESEERVAAAQAVLRQLHPQYESRVRDFVAKDGLRPLRDAVSDVIDWHQMDDGQSV
ncbi:MAG: methyltransferase domain-containing protein [Burkholderiales bacterium]|nr:methyltransferase domain-containing protein [Burkholderiales bacterium]